MNIDQPISQSANQPSSQSESANQPIRISQSANQPINQILKQPASKTQQTPKLKPQSQKPKIQEKTKNLNQRIHNRPHIF
jgi:hypothetical protein